MDLYLHQLIPSHYCAYLMLMTLCLTYIWNSAVLVSSFPREYCNWALHVVYSNMSRFRVTREVKFRRSCCVSYPWKMKAMADYQCVPQTPCIEKMVQQWDVVTTVMKFRLRNMKLPGQISSYLIQKSVQTHLHCRIIFKQILKEQNTRKQTAFIRLSSSANDQFLLMQ